MSQKKDRKTGIRLYVSSAQAVETDEATPLIQIPI